MEHHHHNHFAKGYYVSAGFAIVLMLLAFLVDRPDKIWSGLLAIQSQQDTLITDYMAVAGLGAALVNAGLVTLCSVLLLVWTKEPFNGFTIVSIALMAGFSLFGKNIWNIWPIIGGTWIYAKYQGESMHKHISVALLATSLSPMVSYMTFGSHYASLPAGILMGLFIGFFLPSLSAYTFKIQNGMNLYNMGFACGIFAMMIIPVFSAMGDSPDTLLIWSTQYHSQLVVGMIGLCLVLISAGFFATKRHLGQVWQDYTLILATSGRAPSDYLRMFSPGAVMVNMGANGLLGVAYILLIGGDLNGPTVGGIITIMGFSAFGKHAFNISPVMVGVALGSLGMHHPMAMPALQLAGLFGTTLAPISGYFGWPFGVLAGFIHSALVLETAGPVSGVNLYNNGFSGGLIAIVLFPVLTAVVKHRRPIIQDEEYYDVFDAEDPIDKTNPENMIR